MKKYSILFLSFLSAGFLLSCSSDDDSVLDSSKPEVVINDPVAEEVFSLGGELHIDVDISDNDALSSYKIDIHNNFDGHDHSGVLNTTAQVVTRQATIAPWTYSETFDIEGTPTSYNIHEHIDIPSDIAEGPYHLGIIVVDAAGNETQAYTGIVIGEDHTGEDHGITITSIESADVSRGTEMHAGAEITADHGISTVSIDIHGHGLSPEEGEVAWTFNQTYDEFSGNSAHLHEHIDVPAEAALGEYHMTITVVDSEGNSFAEDSHFQVTEATNDPSAVTISEFTMDEETKAGEDIHVDAAIEAEHGVEEVVVHIHSENEEGWSFEKTFPYDHETSVDFHQHIDIESSAAPGEYHLSLEVKDHQGNIVTEEGHFDIVE